MRVTTAPPEDNARFLAALRELLRTDFTIDAGYSMHLDIQLERDAWSA